MHRADLQRWWTRYFTVADPDRMRACGEERRGECVHEWTRTGPLAECWKCGLREVR